MFGEISLLVNGVVGISMRAEEAWDTGTIYGLIYLLYITSFLLNMLKRLITGLLNFKEVYTRMTTVKKSAR